MSKDPSRRTFIKKTALAGAAAMAIPTFIPSSAFGANDRINAAVLGINGRGQSHISSFMAQKNLQVTTLCDPDMRLLTKNQVSFKEKYNADVAIEQDLRKVFENK